MKRSFVFSSTLLRIILTALLLSKCVEHSVRIPALGEESEATTEPASRKQTDYPSFSNCLLRGSQNGITVLVFLDKIAFDSDNLITLPIEIYNTSKKNIHLKIRDRLNLKLGKYVYQEEKNGHQFGFGTFANGYDDNDEAILQRSNFIRILTYSPKLIREPKSSSEVEEVNFLTYMNCQQVAKKSIGSYQIYGSDAAYTRGRPQYKIPLTAATITPEALVELRNDFREYSKQPASTIAHLSERDQSLHVAMESGDYAGMLFAIENGANVNSQNEHGITPLMIASLRGAEEMVEFLLRKKARIDGKSKNGITPLIMASTNGHIATVKLLLAYGAKVNLRDELGMTAYDYAKVNSRSDIMLVLVSAGANK